MVLAGSINKQIVGWIAAEGGRAIGLCGKAIGHGSEDRDQLGLQHRVEHAALDMLRLADEAEVDRLLDVAVGILPGRCGPSACCC
jgi:hypothetical protein